MEDKLIVDLEKKIDKLIKLSSSLKEANSHLIKKNKKLERVSLKQDKLIIEIEARINKIIKESKE